MPRNSTIEWLEMIEQFPVVSGWQWHPVTWKRFSSHLLAGVIPHCRDTYGNVLLGAATIQLWRHRLNDARIVMQAHLDHPGAVVSMRPQNDSNRYVALVRGGLRGDLVGNSFYGFNDAGEYVGEIIADESFNGYSEKFISFKTANNERPPHYLRGPHSHISLAQSNGTLERWQEGWGLDDHVGCAAVLDIMSRYPHLPVLAALTLDEEVGGWGLSRLLQETSDAGLPVSRWPLLLSMEVTPEYPELGHVCGAGAVWRDSDAVAELDRSFLEWANRQEARRVLSLKGGRCEAGMWAQWGGRSACLAVPCQNSHNGTLHHEWRAERMIVSDINDLAHVIGAILPHYCDHKTVVLPNTVTLRNDAPVIRIHDLMAPVREAAKRTNNFITCLQEVMPQWHDIHSRFGLESVRFASQDWAAWREAILSGEGWEDHIRTLVPAASKKVQDFLGIKWSERPELPVFLFVGAPFNAGNLGNGIGLSTEKLVEQELARVLAHELTHWWMGPILDKLPLRPLELTFLQEGLACWCSMKICNITSAQSIAIPEAQYTHYQNHLPQLKSLFDAWLSGDFLEVSRGRHEWVRKRDIPHPFRIGPKNEWVKFGYFLAMDYVRTLMMHRTNKLMDIFKNWRSDDLQHYLSEGRMYGEGKQCRAV